MPKRKYDYGMMVGTNGKHKYKNREDYFASCSIRAKEAKEQSIEQLKATCVRLKEFNANETRLTLKKREPESVANGKPSG